MLVFAGSMAAIAALAAVPRLLPAVSPMTVALALLLVAAFASWLPAQRATSVDVMTALRQD